MNIDNVMYLSAMMVFSVFLFSAPAPLFAEDHNCGCELCQNDDCNQACNCDACDCGEQAKDAKSCDCKKSGDPICLCNLNDSDCGCESGHCDCGSN